MIHALLTYLRDPKNEWREFQSKGYELLAVYNAECGRGVVHSPEYEKRMAEIQQRFDHEHRAHG